MLTPYPKAKTPGKTGATKADKAKARRKLSFYGKRVKAILAADGKPCFAPAVVRGHALSEAMRRRA